MNSVNASLEFSNFQIHLGRSPHLIPPFVLETFIAPTWDIDITCAQDLIMQLQVDIAEVKDNLLLKYSKHTILIKTDPPKYLSKLAIR
jgi:hypothetical protein